MKVKFILVFALLVFLSANIIAAEKTKDIDFDEKPAVKKRLTEDKINRIIQRIAEDNPEEAEELEKLRKENPEMFMKEIKEHISKRPRRRSRENAERHNEQGHNAMRKGPGYGGPWGEKFAEMEKKKEEYLKWMQENYPEEFTRLEELKDQQPELYFRQMVVSGRKYGRIFEASKTNPELAEILKEDLALKQKREELLKQIFIADGEEKAELTKQLEDVVGQRFDLILKRKQIAYDKLRERLEKLKEEVKASQAEVEKWKETKDAKVQNRIKELLKRAEKFNWDQ